MASVHRSPIFNSPSFNCPRCGALADQEWLALFGRDSEQGGSFVELGDDEVISWKTGRLIRPTWTASRCYSCKDHSIWLGSELVYPSRELIEPESAPHEDMPADAAALFREAVAVLPFSRRAAAALCRASMERLVKALDPECAERTRLDERLIRLEGRVSSSTMQLLNVLRHVGNTALHGERDDDGTATIYVDEDDETIAETFFLAINTLVDELVTRPRRSQELYKALPSNVREAYERKAGSQGGG
ncbi:DUF4145 domain-containing protein [Arthrobacter sp. zg-Y877]|uniref:DUF4145 domain-containing protein n=1 Tax=Arthrobacter sp. zg-Y877 TaxID=3049074 RepID=UPI0025A38E85|nr:DUF4145 domain-containing protein [Arthrobacter sp. zg-Y877]MDM7991360.1 DUF4145 domain-containing protein [Arthrobacter sp. zg-Y877]